MTQEKTRINKDIAEIISSNISLDKKLEGLNNLLGVLTPLEYRDEIVMICDSSIDIANNLGRTEMLAQLYLIKAKSEISIAGPIIHEMKELTMALDWFNFSLDKERQRYKKLDTDLKHIWKKTQKNIDYGFEYLNKNPLVGVAAYCYQVRAEIYGAFYLDLKLLYLNSKSPLIAKISNYKITRWFDLDDCFSVSIKNFRHLSSIKKDCLKFFKESIKLFERENNYEFIINCYINFAFEYHSFNSPIRSKFYEYKAKYLIKKYKIFNNQTIKNNLKNLEKQPLIGSSRDIKA